MAIFCSFIRVKDNLLRAIESNLDFRPRVFRTNGSSSWWWGHFEDSLHEDILGKKLNIRTGWDDKLSYNIQALFKLEGKTLHVLSGTCVKSDAFPTGNLDLGGHRNVVRVKP